MAKLRVFAPAKVNLTLHVGPPGADGRHPLQSVVAFADVGDELDFETPGDPDFVVSGPFAHALAGEADNLVQRAWRLAAPDRPNVRIGLRKILPVASGLGGGSSDAAAALRAAKALVRQDWNEAEMERAALALGADAPVCVRAAPAFMEGIGEVLRPIALPTLHAVLVNPGVAVATGAVFKHYDRVEPAPLTRAAPPAWADADAAIEGLIAGRNDLEEPAMALAPVIGETLTRLRAAPETALARMSGSGATCFGLTRDRAGAETLARRLAEDTPGWWVRAVRLGAVDAAPREA